MYKFYDTSSLLLKVDTLFDNQSDSIATVSFKEIDSLFS